ncbi:MAG: hypothetical protein Q8M40_10825, partial [Legionella sp.]|nr:hypothetical protein [Legionella sp.]
DDLEEIVYNINSSYCKKRKLSVNDDVEVLDIRPTKKPKTFEKPIPAIKINERNVIKGFYSWTNPHGSHSNVKDKTPEQINQVPATNISADPRSESLTNQDYFVNTLKKIAVRNKTVNKISFLHLEKLEDVESTAKEIHNILSDLSDTDEVKSDFCDKFLDKSNRLADINICYLEEKPKNYPFLITLNFLSNFLSPPQIKDLFSKHSYQAFMALKKIYDAIGPDLKNNIGSQIRKNNGFFRIMKNLDSKYIIMIATDEQIQNTIKQEIQKTTFEPKNLKKVVFPFLEKIILDKIKALEKKSNEEKDKITSKPNSNDGLKNSQSLSIMGESDHEEKSLPKNCNDGFSHNCNQLALINVYGFVSNVTVNNIQNSSPQPIASSLVYSQYNLTTSLAMQQPVREKSGQAQGSGNLQAPGISFFNLAPARNNHPPEEDKGSKFDIGYLLNK